MRSQCIPCGTAPRSTSLIAGSGLVVPPLPGTHVRERRRPHGLAGVRPALRLEERLHLGTAILQPPDDTELGTVDPKRGRVGVLERDGEAALRGHFRPVDVAVERLPNEGEPEAETSSVPICEVVEAGAL